MRLRPRLSTSNGWMLSCFHGHASLYQIFLHKLILSRRRSFSGTSTDQPQLRYFIWYHFPFILLLCPLMTMGPAVFSLGHLYFRLQYRLHLQDTQILFLCSCNCRSAYNKDQHKISASIFFQDISSPTGLRFIIPNALATLGFFLCLTCTPSDGKSLFRFFILFSVLQYLSPQLNLFQKYCHDLFQ